MNDPYLLPVQETVENAVIEYADAITSYINAISPDIEIEKDYTPMIDESETRRASSCDIHTKYGFVTIFPDFKSNSARAALLNMGLIRSMEIEGFEDDTIEKSPVYGGLMPYTLENVEIFAAVLTQDFGLQHQKIL
jgi:hypothetical protein